MKVYPLPEPPSQVAAGLSRPRAPRDAELFFHRVFTATYGTLAPEENEFDPQELLRAIRSLIAHSWEDLRNGTPAALRQLGIFSEEDEWADFGTRLSAAQRGICRWHRSLRDNLLAPTSLWGRHQCVQRLLTCRKIEQRWSLWDNMSHIACAQARLREVAGPEMSLRSEQGDGIGVTAQVDPEGKGIHFTLRATTAPEPAGEFWMTRGLVYDDWSRTSPVADDRVAPEVSETLFVQLGRGPQHPTILQLALDIFAYDSAEKLWITTAGKTSLFAVHGLREIAPREQGVSFWGLQKIEIPRSRQRMLSEESLAEI